MAQRLLFRASTVLSYVPSLWQEVDVSVNDQIARDILTRVQMLELYASERERAGKRQNEILDDIRSLASTQKEVSRDQAAYLNYINGWSNDQTKILKEIAGLLLEQNTLLTKIQLDVAYITQSVSSSKSRVSDK